MTHVVLQFTKTQSGEIHVVTSGSEGEPHGAFVAPYSEQEQWEVIALALDALRYEPAEWEKVPDKLKTLKDLGLADEEGFKDLRKTVGTMLFNALPDPVQDAVTTGFDAFRIGGPPVRIELRFASDATDLVSYPWELLYEQERGFLFADMRASLTRYISGGPPPPELLESETPLNLLLVSPRPNDPDRPLPFLTDDESKAIQNALKAHSEGGRFHRDVITLDTDQPAVPRSSTRDLLQDYLRDHRDEQLPHIIHFDCHGGYGRICPSCKRLNSAHEHTCYGCTKSLYEEPVGCLAFENRDGTPEWISADTLGNLLAGKGIRLVVLSACKSAVISGTSVFSGMAPALIRKGIPAVVAMQFTIEVTAVKRFVSNLYQSLADRDPLTLAVSSARASADACDKYRPVLYLRADASNPDGRLFSLGELEAPDVGVDIPPDFITLRERTCREIKALTDDKTLHKLFEELYHDYRTFEDAVETSTLIPNLDAATESASSIPWELLKRQAQNSLYGRIHKLVDKVRDVHPENTSSILKLEHVRSDLERALPPARDEKKLRRTLRVLQSLVANEPSELNQRIIDTVTRLDLGKVVESMRDFVASSERSHGVSGSVANLEKLANLSVRLSTFEKLHNTFQSMEKLLNDIDSSLFEVVEIPEHYLNFIDESIASLDGNPYFAPQLSELRAIWQEMEAELRQKHESRVDDLYRDFGSRFRSLFADIDDAMLDLCKDLDRCGELLEVRIGTLT